MEIILKIQPLSQIIKKPMLKKKYRKEKGTRDSPTDSKPHS